jgi:hypothetical protein
VVAEVRFIGPAKPAHLELLERYLDVAKDLMEDVSNGGEEKEQVVPNKKGTFGSNIFVVDTSDVLGGIIPLIRYARRRALSRPPERGAYPFLGRK